MKYIIAAVAFLAIGIMMRSNFDSDSERSEIWRGSIEIIKSTRGLGIGVDSFGNGFAKIRSKNFIVTSSSAESAHNDILQVLATCGVIGMAIYLAFVFNLFRSIRAEALGSVVAAFICAKFNPISLEAMVLLAVILGVYAKDRESPVCFTGKNILIAGSLFIALCGAYVCFADYLGARDTRSACLANPYELKYKSNYIRALAYQFNRTDDRMIKSAILSEIKRESDTAIRLRPNNHERESYENFVRQVAKLSR